MKISGYASVVLLVLLVSCASNTIEPGALPAGITSAADAHRELLRELTVLSDNHSPIGPEHYERLRSRLEDLQGSITPKEYGQLKKMLDGLNVGQSKQNSVSQAREHSSEFRETVRVIKALADDSLVIAQSRYEDLAAQIKAFESQGIDVTEAQKNLERIKTDAGAAYEIRPVDDHVDRPLKGLPGICETHQACLEYCPNNVGVCKQACLTVDRPELCPYVLALGIPAVNQGSPDLDVWVFDNLPECTNQTFSVSPVDLSQVFEITPQGNIGPPGHTLPTDHIYVHINAGQTSTRTIPLVAPADIYITDVGSSGEEFSIGFALCKDILGYFFHVQGISDKLKEIRPQVSCAKEVLHHECKRTMGFVQASEQLGVVGGLHGNFDIGVYDFRKPLPFVNPLRYGNPTGKGFDRGRPLYIQCPLDYYEPGIARKFYDKIKRTAEPRCGKTMQDILGTLHGNWFISDATAQVGWERQLAFVHDNTDPSQSAISIGGTISEPQKHVFIAGTAGTNNRKFSDVTPDGKIYCYDLNSGKLLVQMTNATQIKVEVTSSCTSFKNPTIYDR